MLKRLRIRHQNSEIQRKTLTSVLSCDIKGQLSFSKHCIGLLYISLVCPNFVCEPVLADPRSLQLISLYWSASSCVLMMTATSCCATMCSSSEAQGFNLEFSRRSRRIEYLYIWLQCLFDKTEAKRQRKFSLCFFFHHVHYENTP